MKRRVKKVTAITINKRLEIVAVNRKQPSKAKIDLETYFGAFLDRADSLAAKS